MTDVSTMTDRELDRALAEAMGLHPDVVRAHGRALVEGLDFPIWHADLNALRDGPERVLRDAGWFLNIEVSRDGATATWDSGAPMFVPSGTAYTPTEARARAEAALAALRVMKGEGNG